MFFSPSALDDDDDDEGHTVVATARGVFNCNGGVLSSIETGVSIIIPQGAIPDSVEQEIYFKVCRDNSILPPLDKEKGALCIQPGLQMWQVLVINTIGLFYCVCVCR